MTLAELNAANDAMLRNALMQCCGSRAWCEQMIELRPFSNQTALLSGADDVWNSLTPEDWLEAFAQHPRIGENSASEWSAREQAAMKNARAETAAAMKRLNVDYQRKFGWIFIVCATAKTAEEMLGLLTARLENDSATELKIAAGEQASITRLRLQKLLAQ